MQEAMAAVMRPLPRALREHLDAHSVDVALFLPSWLLTAFAGDFPPQFTARLLDAMLVRGWRGVLVNVASSLLVIARHQLLALEGQERMLAVIKVRAEGPPVAVPLLTCASPAQECAHACRAACALPAAALHHPCATEQRRARAGGNACAAAGAAARDHDVRAAPADARQGAAAQYQPAPRHGRKQPPADAHE